MLRLQGGGGDTASGGGRCGFPLMPTLQLLVGDAVTNGQGQPGEAANTAAGQLPPGIAAVVWRDPMNNTFASNTLVATLPPFSDGWVREASLTDSRPCAYGCDALYRVRVAAYDGSQTLVSVRLVEVTLRHYLIHVSYRHYLPDRIRTTAEVLHVPIVPWWRTTPTPAPNSPSPSPGPGTAGIGSSSEDTNAALYSTTQSSSTVNTPATTRTTTSGPWALQLLGDAAGPRTLTDQPPAAWSADALRSAMLGVVCSRQWSFTLLLQVGAGVVL